MSLRRKVLLQTTGLLALLVVAICSATAIMVAEDARQTARDNGCAVADFLAGKTEQLLLWDDHESIQTLLQETVADQPTVDYAFLRKDGETYASTYTGRAPRKLLLLNTPPPGSPELTEFHSREGYAYYDVAALVPDTGAVIHVGLSKDAIEALSREHLWEIALIGCVVFALGLTMAGIIAVGVAREGRHAGEALQESESRGRAILDASTDAILQVDRSMHVQWANNVVADLAGGRIAGCKCHRALFGSDTECSDCPCLKAMLTGKTERATVRRPATSAAADESVWDVCGIPMKNESGSVVAVVEMARNVTKDKEIEEELREYSTALESTNVVIEDLYEKADMATQAKNEFLANMSHEIRTPMTSILGYADVLIEEEIAAGAQPRRIEALQTIRRNGEFLLTLIDDILDLSKIETGKLQTEVVDCDPIAVIDEVVALMRVRADGKGISLDIEYSGVMPRTIICDPLRLRQILVNLIGNAVKFTDTGGVKLISHLVLGVNGPSALQFDIVDTGIGISPEHAQNLFTPFSQADSSVAKNYGGTGLGLVISRRLAEMLGGDVTFSSRPGKGSTFTLTVETGSLADVEMLNNPTADNEVAKLANTAGETSGAGVLPDDDQVQVSSANKARTTGDNAFAGDAELALSGRILLAEDGLDNRRLIELFLKQAGADVTTVEDGAAACEEIQAAVDLGKPFDLVLMDMQMPIKDGYEATRELRQTGCRAPILALTAYAREGDRQKCIDAGCDEYIAKPIKRDDLLSTVRRYCNLPHPAPDTATTAGAGTAAE